METKDLNRNIKKPIIIKNFGRSCIKLEFGKIKNITNENASKIKVRPKAINKIKLVFFKSWFSVFKFLYKT